MIRVVDQAGVFIQENGSGFLEGDPVLAFVGSGFTRVPGKFDIAHSIILAISSRLLCYFFSNATTASGGSVIAMLCFRLCRATGRDDTMPPLPALLPP